MIGDTEQGMVWSCSLASYMDRLHASVCSITASLTINGYMYVQHAASQAGEPNESDVVISRAEGRGQFLALPLN
jgi:hypothetical protein